MVTINFADNAGHAKTVENWIVDYENENGNGINREHVTEPLNGVGIYAIHKNTLVAGLTFRIQNDWIFLCCGYVLPEYRGRRIYSTFIYELECMAKQRGLSGIFVSTYTFEAPHIYEHLGFTKGATLEDLPKGNTNIDYYKRITSGTGAKTSPVMTADFQFYSTIAVDFDGTLCENRFPDIGKAKPLVIEYIKRQAEAGAKIILYTCRENGTRRALLDEAIAFCGEHGIPLYAINENPANQYGEEYGTGADGRKLFADLYIDDKAANVTDIETLIERETEVLRVEKYSWEFNGEAENWGYDACDTVEECIAAANQAVAERDYRTDTPPKVVYIGENIPFMPCVNAESVLESIEQDAADFAGDLGEDWNAYDPKKRDELTELADHLSHTVNEWLKKYGYEPTFYAVQNIKPYKL